MITVSVFYPSQEGKAFDMGYYCNSHIPMLANRLGASCKNISVEQGIAGGAPGTSATYAVIAHLSFDSVDAFQSAFAPHAPEIMADIPNYTTIEPVIQISEVKM